MSDGDWNEVLIDVYERLLMQQQSIRNIAVGFDALTNALAAGDPRFAVRFAEAYDQSQQGQLSQSHNASIEAIRLTIAELKKIPKDAN
ncbi:MAG: hypothetical protein WA871_00175 [Candidatus Acidiferrales bacterium]